MKLLLPVFGTLAMLVALLFLNVVPREVIANPVTQGPGGWAHIAAIPVITTRQGWPLDFINGANKSHMFESRIAAAARSYHPVYLTPRVQFARSYSTAMAAGALSCHPSRIAFNVILILVLLPLTGFGFYLIAQQLGFDHRFGTLHLIYCLTLLAVGASLLAHVAKDEAQLFVAAHITAALGTAVSLIGAFGAAAIAVRRCMPQEADSPVADADPQSRQ